MTYEKYLSDMARFHDQEPMPKEQFERMMNQKPPEPVPKVITPIKTKVVPTLKTFTKLATEKKTTKPSVKRESTTVRVKRGELLHLSHNDKCKDYYQRNKKAILERTNKYYKDNIERDREKHRERQRRYRQRQREIKAKAKDDSRRGILLQTV